MNQAKRQTHRIGFTMARLEHLQPPDHGRVFWHDTACPGLALCVTEAGTKTFYVYRWHDGRPLQIPVARFPALNVEEARKRAKDILAKLAAGVDVQAARRERREEPTLGELWSHWEAYALAHKKPKSQVNDKHLWESFLKPWAGRRIATIRQADVRGLHTRIGLKNGNYAANRMLSLLGAMYVKAGEIGFKGANPTKGVVRFPEKSRDRFLRPDELQVFFQALHATLSELMRDFFFVALLTGQRRANVEGMRFEDISFQLALWRIPGEVSKEGKPIVVPLSAPVLEILTRRREADPTGEWVFPSRSSTGHITEPKRAWKQLLTEAGLEDVRLHDLRRTLGSWQALGGSSLQVIGRSLGHTDLRSTQVYSRLDVDPIRASVDAATQAMLVFNKPAPGEQPADGGPKTVDVEPQGE